MKIEEEIVNKVAGSGLITIDLEDFYPKEHVVEIDIKDFLYEGIILKEKDFRKSLGELHWNDYANKIIAVFCSEDAIVPKWAYMLVTMHASAYTHKTYFGSREFAIEETILANITDRINPEDYRDKRVVIKGCSDRDISERVYMAITNLLMPVAPTG